MSHRVHPKIFRVKKTSDWNSRWITKKGFPKYLEEDFIIRRFLKKGLKDAKRIRKDEGQVSKGGTVEKGRTAEGRENLELQAPKESSGAKAQGEIATFSKVKAGLYKSDIGDAYIAKEGNTWSIADGEGSVQAEGFKSLREAIDAGLRPCSTCGT